MNKRSTVLLSDVAALPASTVVALGAPKWATQCTLTWKVTADGTGAGTIQVREDAPDGTSGVAVAGLVSDALTVSATNIRKVSFGVGRTAISGANYDATDKPVSAFDKVVITESAGALTASKLWAEFSGDVP